MPRLFGAAAIGAAPIPPVPEAVDMRQARIKLRREGVLDQVDAMIRSSADEEAIIEWDYAAVLRRDHPFVNGVQMMLGLTVPEMNAWFIDASLIGPMGQ